MYTAPLQKPALEKFSHLPSYAAYILQHHLDDFNRHQLQLSYELKLPLLKQLATFTDEQILQLSRDSLREMLEALAQNKVAEHIEATNKKWKENQLPLVDKYDIRAEDINLIAYIRKMAFMHFLEPHCRDTAHAIALMREIDLYMMQLELQTTNTFISLLKDSVHESSHLIHKVNNTIPGAIYVFDMVAFKGIFSNKKVKDVTGYEPEELNSQSNRLLEMVHPEDREMVLLKREELKNIPDNEIISYKYRFLKKDGHYRWLRNFESVFRRSETGAVTETIGIILDVDREHRAVDALKENEMVFKRAEAIMQIGSYTWEIAGNKLKWSDELYRIYGLDPEKDEISFEMIESFNNPEDTALVREQYRKAIAAKEPFDFFYRITARDGTEKILQGRGEMILDERGEVKAVIGTAQDVTERQTLLRKLAHSESIHRQAEELTKMGSWTWDLKTNQTEWSEQMYQIYEIEEHLKTDVFKDYVHPEDREKADKILEDLLQCKSSDHTLRIITKKGKVKKLHTIARVHCDQFGNPDYIIGAEQDISERENLLETLQRTEKLYKRAEELANMGNWSWHVASGTMEWSDQLYRIYGMKPQSEAMTIEKLVERAHPEDRDHVRSELEQIQVKDLLDFKFRIITPDNITKILRMVAEVQRNKQGEAIHVIGTERDITEKQTMIDKLRQSEMLYKQAQLLSHVGNWSWDIHTGVISWSDELYRIYGLAPQSEQLNFESYIAMVHPDDREKLRNQVKLAHETGLSWELTHRIIRRNGEKRILYSSGEVLKDEKGQPATMIGTAQDITERQGLIDRLQESEKFFVQAQSLARLGSWTMDVKTMDFSWSDEMYNIFEMPKNTALSLEKWLTYVAPEQRDEVMNYYYECLREKKLYDKTHKIILHNGKTKVVHRKGEFLYDAEGNPVKMIGTTQDITEEFRVQQELKENQTFIRKITDATPSIIASYNINTGKYVFISEGLEKLLGYPTTNVIEKGLSFFAGIMHPEDVAHVMEKNKTALDDANQDPSKNDMVVEFTYRMKHRNGTYRWFHTYGTIFDRNEEGQVEHVLNISLDITDQIDATKTIKEQEHFIQQIADASPTILYLFDVKEQSIVYINREIFFVLGYTPDEILEMKDGITTELYHPEDLSLLPARIASNKNFQQVESMMQYECRLKSKQGDWRWLLIREIVFKSDENGAVTQILGAALDINRRKEMEKTILQNTLLLEQSNASLEEFAYVASHDLKEPLRKISTFGDRLVANQADQLSPESQLYLQKIVDASQRMQTMINDLLSISMISGNTAFEQVGLQGILEETLQTLEFKIEQHNAIIEADPLPEAFIIPFQIRQVFQNLLSNSLKFVKPGVQPKIRIQYVCLKQEEMEHHQVTRSDKYHQISFADNGIGFDNEYAGKIFAIFQRLHGRSEYEGSGIGLAICKKIIEHHGGTIFAEGTEGEGARFIIILPA